MFESSQLDCLITNTSGIYGLYLLRTVYEFTKFFSFENGKTNLELRAMKAVYDIYTAEEIARIGLEAAAEFDDSTGLPVEVLTIKLRNC